MTIHRRSRARIGLGLFFCLLFFGFLCRSPQAEAMSDTEIRTLITALKTDPRGPFQRIRWFCPDGSTRAPRDPCPMPGGVQHGQAKESVRQLLTENNIDLTQILTGGDPDVFWDAANGNQRLLQYILIRYLIAVDDGWIFHRARYYRGSVQDEDECAWGRSFLVNLLGRDELLKRWFFIVREACREIPHRGDTDRFQSIRALSKTLAEQVPDFNPVRIKLHGRPEASDLEMVKDFGRKHFESLSADQREKLQALETAMAAAFDENRALARIREMADAYPDMVKLPDALARIGQQPQFSAESLKDCAALADWLLANRRSLLTAMPPEARLALMDISLEIEGLLFRYANRAMPPDYAGHLEMSRVLIKAAAGCGYLELAEWEALAPRVAPLQSASMLLARFTERAGNIRRSVEWAAGMIRITYSPIVERFVGFEPQTAGFVDNRIRMSLLLPLGQLAGRLNDAATRFYSAAHQIEGLSQTGGVRGLNPGLAAGILTVVAGKGGETAYDADGIYALHRPPADLKPVAGLLTVSEGNLVSHVQLLARNLGIPNAVLAPEQLQKLAPLSGRRVFYAVSPRGRVVLKPAEQMTAREIELTAELERSQEKIAVPVDKIDLGRQEILMLKDLRVNDSGRLCGPKAANLGQLKALFPEHVVDGLVIPFGIFRRHMDQPMPGTSGSYWDYLIATFAGSGNAIASGQSVLERLRQLREAIRRMPLLGEFRASLDEQFQQHLGAPMGDLPVFVRSDTNMEDLENFTGAGLNLTVFNVVDKDTVLQAIRDVWASPYTERSYGWRQKYLRNPENVFPSILILPTVDVDASGVIITMGVENGDPSDITVAFSRGAGGAVEGQTAETWLLRHDGTDQLMSPARETRYRRLPATGGSAWVRSSLEKTVLDAGTLALCREMAGKVRDRLYEPGDPRHKGPFDIEMGFKDGRVWLFQARPFVENQRANSLGYLRDLDPVISQDRRVILESQL